ncbi:hypothetical protein [Meiothermus hypogaeus]|uniref:Uncharacterized protein n=2 Tax=Meiothermus hypogaeus TaxID=884155 RepID=A0A511R3M9_9DEIN|nr:hypothetical protein [Meiothermus hypogaeus]RIH74587.1 hypothetical protein Mhypo_03264 [Meiothermus hypogaeus]GEM83917.1 hypothetical protein MHY01S_20830 [Meiothermus hypogaeus NBRC 106114]
MAFTRVPVSKNQQLGPGLYEAVLAISGDISRVTRTDLQRVLSAKFGQAVEVVDWGRSGGNYVLQFRVRQTQAQVQSDDLYQPAAFFVPIIITVAAIAGAIYLAYRLTIEIKSAFALVSQPARDTAVGGVGVGMAGLGVGAALFGLYLLAKRG